MAIKQETVAPESRRSERLLAAGGVVGAFAALSCCILPVALFSLGVSGAWIADFTQLAPFQPYIIAATILFLGAGYWLVRRASKRACADGTACARPLPNRLVKGALITSTILVIAALGFDWLAPRFLN